MSAARRLGREITEFELVHQKLPSCIVCTDDVRQELIDSNAVPEGMVIIETDAPVSVLRVE